jgi:hypothetical protein
MLDLEDREAVSYVVLKWGALQHAGVNVEECRRHRQEHLRLKEREEREKAQEKDREEREKVREKDRQLERERLAQSSEPTRLPLLSCCLYACAHARAHNSSKSSCMPYYYHRMNTLIQSPRWPAC